MRDNLNRKGEFMNSLYVLGNGFDLYMEMETRYRNFFENKGYDSVREDFEKNLKKLIREYAEYFMPVSLKIKKLNDLYDKEIKKINNLFLLYLIISDNKLIDWKDVEKQIKPYIEYITAIPKYPKITEEFFDTFMMKDEAELKRVLLKKYIEEKNLNFGENTEKNMMLEELNKFEKEFGQYIKNLDNPLEVDHICIIKEKIENVFNNSINDLKESGINVITFNYTDYLKDYFKVFVNIHGTTENPIFGIDSKEAEENYQYIYFTKTSRVLEANIEKKEIVSPLPDIAYTGEIVFFGHSLAEADYSYFQSIFDYYDIYNNTINLKFLYHNYSVDCKEKEKMHASVMKLINTYGKSLDNKDKGSNLLHKLLLESRIKIVEIK